MARGGDDDEKDEQGGDLGPWIAPVQDAFTPAPALQDYMMHYRLLLRATSRPNSAQAP